MINRFIFRVFLFIYFFQTVNVFKSNNFKRTQNSILNLFFYSSITLLIIDFKVIPNYSYIRMEKVKDINSNNSFTIDFLSFFFSSSFNKNIESYEKII